MATAAASMKRHPRRYWFRLIRLFVVALVGALFVLPTGLGALSSWALTHPVCNMGATAAEHGFERYEEVTFPSTRGIVQQGYFFPGDNGATIIVVPAYSNGRGAEPHYANMFQQAGFNVLTLNSRACTPRILHSLGYQEVEDIEAAYAYLITRSDVDPDRISLHGFSSAGATSLMAAARIPQIRSVTAEGGYHDFEAMLGLKSSLDFFARLYALGAAATYRLVTGDGIGVLNPLEAIGHFGSRPVLLTYGSEEISLPGARLMLEYALQNGVDAELWVVEGAGHGNYLSIAGEEYVQRIVGFHRRALLGEE
jgi:pimeloyl-ACP methyl ester carboxylesterase